MREPIRDLIIVGAGGLGRETLEVVRALNAEEARWNVVGFVDDDPGLHGRTVGGIPVLGPVTEAAARRDTAVSVCIGSPLNNRSRRTVVDRLDIDDGRCASLVHPTATVPPDAELGPGVIVLAHVVMTTKLAVGKHVTIMPGVVLTHDDVVGSFVTLAAGAKLGGGVHVEEGAYLGAGACVKEYVRIGAWSVVGMGAVVTRDVPPRQLWAGVPAKALGGVPRSG